MITAGFGETGEDGRRTKRRLRAKVRAAGIRMIGPNCMGILNTDPAVRLNATFSPVFPPAGPCGVSRRRAARSVSRFSTYVAASNLGISTFVSVGNKADVSGERSHSVLGGRSATPTSSSCISRASGTRGSSPSSRGEVGRAQADRRGEGRPIPRRARGRPRRTPARWPRATRSSTRSSGRPASSGPRRSRSCSTWRRSLAHQPLRPGRASRS